MSSEQHTLSSAQTFFTKVVVPILWIGMSGLCTIVYFFLPNSGQTRSYYLTDTSEKWFVLFLAIFGGSFIWWTCARLKRVRIDDKALYISNYLRELTVPLANVAEISEKRWLGGHPVTIQFHSDTDFGSYVIFIPKARWFAWSPHPVVEEIQQAVNRATGRGRA